MSRNTILILGVICWSVAAVDAIVHLMLGDFLVPAVMGSLFVVWIGLRRYQASNLARRERAEVTA
jgi:hypothetical protein